MTIRRRVIRKSYFEIISFAVAFVFLFAAAALGQSSNSSSETVSQTQNSNTTVAALKAAALQPLMSDYKAVKIGMSADEVRDKIDKKPKLADDDGFYYIFSDDETAQIVLDADKKVRAISISYADTANAPTYETIFGSPAAPSADGKVYNLVRYPEAGYWIAYDRTAGDKPTVTITMQKM